MAFFAAMIHFCSWLRGEVNPLRQWLITISYNRTNLSPSLGVLSIFERVSCASLVVVRFVIIYHYRSGLWRMSCHCLLGQCLNATNSSGENAYRTFLKYLQVSFQFGLRTQHTLNFNNNIGECLYSVRCYRSVRENAHGIVFRAVCVLPSLVTKSRPRRFATLTGLGDSCG